MSSLLFLTSADFTLGRSVDGQVMCIPIHGFSLILFYSEKCKHCKTLLPIFRRLPETVGGCQFGMVNVNTNKKCIAMSKQTINPLEYVPYIVLYFNGKPCSIYKGPHDSSIISRFIVEMAKNIKGKQSSNTGTIGNGVLTKQKNKIPAYTIGTPLCGEGDVCYLEFDTAYNSQGEDKRNKPNLPKASGMN